MNKKDIENLEINQNIYSSYRMCETCGMKKYGVVPDNDFERLGSQHISDTSRCCKNPRYHWVLRS